MSQNRLPPPRAEACLVRLRPSSQKGGTIIAEDVTDRATHERRLCDPDGYRPPFCPNCGEKTLHLHDYRWRALLAEPGDPEARIVRHECVECTAIWQILPAFIARHLWRSWKVVEYALTGSGPAAESRHWPPVPERTLRRWRARWHRSAHFLIQVLAVCGDAAWSALAGELAAEARCADFVAAHTRARRPPVDQRLAAVAALVYRLQLKVRLV
jgi:hypothetical protein